MPQLNKMYRKTNSVSSTSPLIGLQDPLAISPLQRFVRAKKLINQTFDELTKYLKEVRDFLMDCEVSDELDHETRKDLEQVIFLHCSKNACRTLLHDGMQTGCLCFLHCASFSYCFLRLYIFGKRRKGSCKGKQNPKNDFLLECIREKALQLPKQCGTLSQMGNVARSGNVSRLGNNLLHFCCSLLPDWETVSQMGNKI